MNGSHTPENPQDVQCKHCGRYYRNDGIHGHEPTCPLRGENVTIVPLDDESTVDRGDRTPAARGLSEPPEGEDAGGQPPDDDRGPDSSEEPATARTDGGPQHPPMPAGAPADRNPDGQRATADDEPDARLVPADEWAAEVEARNPRLAQTDKWAEIRAVIDREGGPDRVDLDATDLREGEVELV